MEIFTVVLRVANYNQGFFNIGVSQSNLIGEDNEKIKIYLGFEKEIIGRINRTANINKTPRIMCGVEYKNWVQTNFIQGDLMTVNIINSNEIKLSK